MILNNSNGQARAAADNPNRRRVSRACDGPFLLSSDSLTAIIAGHELVMVRGVGDDPCGGQPGHCAEGKMI